MTDSYLRKRKSPSIKSNHDDRAGLGYGTLEPKYHLPLIQNDNYPYDDPDDHPPTDDQVDAEDLDTFVTKTNMGYHITDFMSNKKNNPFYFAAGNTKLGEATTKNNMVPIPDLYKGRQVALGGTTSGHVHIGTPYPSRGANDISYGTKHGYSKAPLSMNLRHSDLPEYEINDIPPTDDDILLSLRMLIDDIHDEQEQGKNDS